MKRVTLVLYYALLALHLLVLGGIVLCPRFGYSFRLLNPAVFGVLIAVLSVAAVIFGSISKLAEENKKVSILLTILMPLSVSTAGLCLITCSNFLVSVCAAVSVGCSCVITAQYGKPRRLKITMLALSGVALFLVCVVSFFTAHHSGLVPKTVVQTLDSPSGRYYAQVIESDQGAMGGDTLVDVYEHKVIHVLLFKLEKKPQRVYFGDWGEFKDMQIHWKSDGCLVINGIEYEIA